MHAGLYSLRSLDTYLLLLQMDQLHERCHAVCAKAKFLLHHGVPEHLYADAQQYIGDLEERLRPGSTASSANSSQDQLMLLTSSAVDLGSLGLDVALDLSKRVDALSKRVDALEEDKDLLVLRELGSQCENKLYRLCVKVPLSAKEVRFASLPRLRKDKRLDEPLLKHYVSNWTGMEDGLAALKEMGGLAVAHPLQGASPSKEELVSLVDKHAGPLVKSDVLQVIAVLVDAAEKLEEPLFVPTM